MGGLKNFESHSNSFFGSLEGLVVLEETGSFEGIQKFRVTPKFVFLVVWMGSKNFEWRLKNFFLAFWEFLETENGLATNLVDGKWNIFRI